MCVCVCYGTVTKREKNRVDSKTPPCVHSKRPRVCRHHAHMCFNMCAWCRHTRGRFECTHGGVFERTHGNLFNGHTGSKGHRQFCSPKFTHVWSSRASEDQNKKPMDLIHFQFENRSREQHVADSSNHSLCLIKLFSFRNPEGHCGGNQL